MSSHSQVIEPLRRRHRVVDKRPDSFLLLDEATICQAARLCGPRRSLPLLCLNYALTAARIRWRKILFRQSLNHLACAAYSQMQLKEFQAINARQAWANWRTIPRNLAGRLPARPVFALDLCCGIGESTEVLAWYCAPGSTILGLEYNPAFVHAAYLRRYRHSSGRNADVAFAVQNILQTFRAGTGEGIGDESVDLVNASGAIGVHFDSAATAIVARECGRVLKRGGLALIDAGREGTPTHELTTLFAKYGFQPVHRARSCLADRYWQICMQKDG